VKDGLRFGAPTSASQQERSRGRQPHTSADPKTFGKQAAHQHERHRKDIRYSLAEPGPRWNTRASWRRLIAREYAATPAKPVALRFGCYWLFDLTASVQSREVFLDSLVRLPSPSSKYSRTEAISALFCSRILGKAA
jgi:hypothetical protein